jgi:hypothetical protein
MFLAQTCVDHGQVAQTGVCCDGFTAWGYDANTQQVYDGFACWNATCAENGQYAPPVGVQGGGQCCSGYSIGGKCAPKPQDIGCATVGKAPLASQPCCSGLEKDATGICNVPKQDGGFFDGLDTTVLMYAGGALLLLMMLGKKR